MLEAVFPSTAAEHIVDHSIGAIGGSGCASSSESVLTLENWRGEQDISDHRDAHGHVQEVAVVVLDASVPLTEQDLRIVSMVEEAGRGLVIVMNNARLAAFGGHIVLQPLHR